MTEETVECPVCSHTMTKVRVTITATKAQTVSYRCKYCDKRVNIQTTKEEQAMTTTKRRCPRCGGFVSDRADQCKVCGLPMKTKAERRPVKCDCGGTPWLANPNPHDVAPKFSVLCLCGQSSRMMPTPDTAMDEWEKMQARIKAGTEAETVAMVSAYKVLESLNGVLNHRGGKSCNSIDLAIKGIEELIMEMLEGTIKSQMRSSQLETQLRQKKEMLLEVHIHTEKALSSLGVSPSKESAVKAAERLANLAGTIGAKMTDLIAGKNDLLDNLTGCLDRIEQLEEKLAKDGLTHDSKASLERRQELKQAVKKSREPDGEAWIVYDRHDATWMGQDSSFTTCGIPMPMHEWIAQAIADSYSGESIVARPITWTFKEGEE